MEINFFFNKRNKYNGHRGAKILDMDTDDSPLERKVQIFLIVSNSVKTIS